LGTVIIFSVICSGTIYSLILPIFNSFESIVIGEQVSAKGIKSNYYNSQTMNLLAYVANYDPNPDRSYETVPVIDDQTLSPDLARTNSSSENSTQISTYVVREGDTVSSVAKMFNVSINTVLWANDLTSKSYLKSGQTLVILPVTGIKYSVQKNDSVIGIAKMYKADVNEIYSFNDIDSSTKLTIGQELIIPNAETSISSYVSRPVSGFKGPIYEPVLVDVKKLPNFEGYYACPVPSGRLSQDLHGKNGIDLAAPLGTPMKASADGTVIISKSNGAWNGAYGNFVVISHANNTQTLYAHMSKSIVAVGEKVNKGQTIGYIGMTGLTTGPHIHFEVRGAKNPFIGKGCN
jgi:LysM repeat protein